VLQRMTPMDGTVQPIRQRRLLDECARVERWGQPFVLVLLSLEGGARGLTTETLDLIGDSLRGGVRQSDVVVRAGPALYAVLLIGADAEPSQSVGDRLVRHLRADAGSLVRELAEWPLRFGVGVFDGSGSIEGAIAQAEQPLRAEGAAASARAA
jgi:hypothetical protein